MGNRCVVNSSLYEFCHVTYHIICQFYPWLKLLERLCLNRDNRVEYDGPAGIDDGDYRAVDLEDNQIIDVDYNNNFIEIQAVE